MRTRTFKRLIGLALVATLASCGGSGNSTSNNQPSPPSAATPQTTIGKIAGFGSVFVNGVEFDTTGASYDVNGTAASGDDALHVGMVVKVQGSVNADGRTGKCDRISYDSDVNGVVQDLVTDTVDPNIKTFTVFGVSIRADMGSTNFEGKDDPAFSFDTIANGDHVEVSGEFDGDVLVASFIEKQAASDNTYEAKGKVDQYNGSDQFVLVLRNGATLNVTVDAGAELPSSGVMDGQYVEIRGTIPDPVNAPDSILASKVELKYSDRMGDGDHKDVEVRGVLNHDTDTDTWSVMDVQLVFSDSTEFSPSDLADKIADLSADGLYVEVEGQYVNDALQVHKISLQQDNFEFEGDVESVTATDAHDGSVTLSFGSAVGTVDVNITPDTMFLEDRAWDHYDLSSVMAGDKVEIKARKADDGMLYASKLHREDHAGYKVDGPVDAIDDVSITLAGVTFTVDANTRFENGTPAVGDYVEVEDHDGDGTADSVDFGDRHFWEH